MKKLISLFLCILMVMSAMVPAFADGETGAEEGYTVYTNEEYQALSLEKPLLLYWKTGILNDQVAVEDRLENTPTKYLFKTDNTSDDKEYIILKNVNAGANDGYFVMTNGYIDSCQQTQYNSGYTASSTNISHFFDIKDENCAAYKMNQSGYIEEKFPLMKNYINMHKWYTEPTTDATEGYNAYSTDAKIALLSLTEYVANADRIGVKVGLSQWITRTPNKNKNLWYFDSRTKVVNGNATVYSNWNGRANRPCFYLSEDFFKNVKLDMTLLKTEDSEAAKIIKNIASTEEGLNALKTNAGYTSEELIELGIAAGGVQITSATLEGTGKCGDTLVATAATNKTATKTEYEWIKVNADNTQEALDSTTNNYTVKFADLGASIKCFVKVYDGEVLSHAVYTNSVSTETKPTFPTSYSSYKLSGTVATDGIAKTPDAYKFSVDGKELTLLQSVNAGENDGQFVTLTTPVNPGTTIPYYKAATVDEFKALDFTYDPTNPKSIAYGINQDSFLNQYIPSSAKAYLNTHRWWNEGISNTTGGYTKDAFATESKVAIMSYTEYLANYDRVGYQESSIGLVLRTPRYDSSSVAFTKGSPCLVLVTNKDYNSASSSTQYRFSQLTVSSTATDDQILNYGYYQDKPICFYLNPEFFANVKVDFTAENTEVIAILREKLAEKSVDELIGMGYSYKEIKTLFPSTEVDSIEMYGFAKSGDNSKITYKCENTTDGEITFRPVVAVYGTDGTLLQSYIASSDLTLAAGEVALAPLDIAADISNAATLKTFAWSSLDSIVPLSDCTTVNYSTLASEP